MRRMIVPAITPLSSPDQTSAQARGKGAADPAPGDLAAGDLAPREEPMCAQLAADPAIAGLLATVRGHFGLEIAYISRYLPGNLREFTHVSSDLSLPFGPGFCEPRDDALCWHILEGRLPGLIADAGDFALAARLPLAGALALGCHVGAPMRLADGQVWGSLGVGGRQPDRTLNPRDLEILNSFAQIAAGRIEEGLVTARHRAAARQRVSAMLDGQAVTIFQQPIHDLATGLPAGIECLARFPDTNRRGPALWFEDAQRAGLGPALEMTAIGCALESLAHVPGQIFAAINASPSIILSGELHRAIAHSGHAGELLIEVSDHHQTQDLAALAAALDELRPLAAIALDDMGSGFGGLGHVRHLRPDVLKLEMALARGIDGDPARRAMAGGMVEFARDLGCRLIAGGIETEGEAKVMRDLGVDFGQGYFFARPLPVAAAQQHLLGILAG